MTTSHSALRAGALLCFFVSFAPAAQHSPYAAEATRSLKALSEQEVADYLAGKGMGLAKTAELNGFPGPMHVLELSSKLQLGEDQRLRTKAVFDDMRAQAVALGRELIDAERALDAAFSQRTITPDELTQKVTHIASLHGKIREAHLKAHIVQVTILSPEQARKYDELRGYERAEPSGHRSKHRH